MISEQPIFNTWTGDGVTTVFNHVGRLYVAADLQVFTYNPGVDVVPVKMTSGFTVSVAGDFSGAAVTITPAPAAGVKVGTIRRMDLTQDINISNTDYVPPSIIEQQIDRQVMMNQEAVRFATVGLETDPFDFTKTARANMVLVFDINGNPTFVADPFPLMGAWSNATTYTIRSIVERNGVAYINRIASNLNIDPATDGGANWQMFGGDVPLNPNLVSWQAVTRATGFDAFAAAPTSTNLRALVADEAGAGALYFVGGGLGTPASGSAANLTGLPVATGIAGLGTGVAAFLAAPSSANLVAALTDETGTGALVFANTPTLVTPNIGAATGLSLTEQTTVTGTYSATARYPVNSFVVSADNLDMGLDGGKVDGLFINHLFGGAATRGGRHALETIGVLTAATASDNPDRNYVGAAFTGWAIASDGGGLGTEKGAIFGLNGQGVLATGATNFLNVTAAEFDVAVNTGASVQYKSGIQVCARADDAVQGYLYDCMVGLSNASGAVGWNYGILVGPMNSGHPMKTTGTIFATTGSATVANGIDFSSYTISGALLKGPGVSIAGDGVSNSFTATNASFELGNPNAVNTPFIDFHSSGNVVDYDVRLLVSGGSAVAGTGTLTITGGVSISAFAAALFFQPTGTTVPTNGVYLPATNTLGWAVNTTAKMRLAGSALTPAADNGTALGTTALEWSGLFLASGGAINFANGNTTLTHGTLGRLILSGSLARGAPVIKSADFTVADTENWLVNNKAAATCTVTLPAVASYTGREITIMNYQAFTVVSASSNVVPLVGGAASTAILAATAGKWVTLVSDGGSWRAMAGN